MRRMKRVLAAALAVLMLVPAAALAADNYYITVELTGPDRNNVEQTFFARSDYGGTLGSPLTDEIAKIMMGHYDEVASLFAVAELKSLVMDGAEAYLSPDSSDWTNFVDLNMGSVSGSAVNVLRNKNSVYGDLEEGTANTVYYVSQSGTYALTVTLAQSPVPVSSDTDVDPTPSVGPRPGSDGPGTDIPKTVTSPFADITPGDWFWEGVNYAAALGIMRGMSVTEFAPEITTTRAMIVTILYRIEEEPGVLGENPYSDVEPGQYYDRPVNWASANGIVNGYGNGLFGPDDPITREQMAAILYRYAVYKGYRTSFEGDLSAFSDAGEVSAYAVSALTWCVYSGIINGITTQLLAPQGNATRAQAATILMRFIQNVSGK